ncbi:MAG TPA: type II toxin-antitoxin system VapC family toxin [Verrucomicrobiae bacterium]
MAWLLDTNAWILHLKNPGGPIEQHLNRHTPAEVLLCSVVKAELWYGAQKYEPGERRLRALQTLFQAFVSLPFDDAAARHYGVIRHGLEARGQIIGPNDLQIAAICLAHGLTLVSSNTSEFSRVAGLKVEDWTRT